MTFAHGETVIRQRRQLVANPYSGQNDLGSWDTPGELAIAGCGFDPGGSSEPLEDARAAVITKPTVYAPTGADILPADRLVVRGKTYSVDGEPAAWSNPFTGWTPGLVVTLILVEG